jgi:outer membrane protein assembly factor BamA
MDYFGRKGGRGFVDYQLGQAHTLRAEVNHYRYETLSRNSNWSLFGGEKDYPSNPRSAAFSIGEGKETALRLIAAFDWRNNSIFPEFGWQIEGFFEHTAGDFATDGLFMTLKRYQPTFSDQKLLGKLMFGTRSGSFAYQHILSLGGLSSLRGYRDKEFEGNRLLFANLTYIIGQNAFGGFLRDLPLRYFPLWETISIGLFADAGYAWIADPINEDAGLFDFGDFELRDLRTNLGISLLVSQGLLRVDFAKRNDRGYDDWRITFRIFDIY